MAFTYNAISNRIFVDPDTTTEDLVITLDDVVAAYPAYVTKVNQVYFFTASLILCGTDTSRVEMSVESTTFYFTNGSLGNDGGRLILGTKYTTDEGDFYKDGCLIVLDGDDAAMGGDTYRMLHNYDRDTTTKQYPICGEDGELFAYDTKWNYINGSARNDMLDVPVSASEVEIIDCHFDGNQEYGGQACYTHLFLINMYMENVKITNFGVFELKYQSLRDWTGIQILKASYGVSVFGGNAEAPVRLKDLTIKGATYIGKKPGNSYLELIDLNYDGTNWDFNLSSGWCKVLSSVDVTALEGVNTLEGARTIILSETNTKSFDLLTDVNGTFDTREVLTKYSSEGSTTFDIEENPFVFRAWKYGYNPVEVPVSIEKPTSLTASFITNNNITLTEAEAEVIDVEIIEYYPDSIVNDSSLDNALVYDDIETYGVWNTSATSLQTDDIYTLGGQLFILRKWNRVDWNDGAIVYQTFPCVANTDYTIQVNIESMGDAASFRMGFDTYDDFICTTSGDHTFTYNSGANTELMLMVNTDGSSYTEHVVINSINVYDASSALNSNYPLDPDGNAYKWEIDCKGNGLNDVYHKLQLEWSKVNPIFLTYSIAEALEMDASGNYYGGKGIIFTNYTGSLVSTIASDGTTYIYPSNSSFKFTVSPSVIGYEWRIYSVTAIGSLAGSTELLGEESAIKDNQTYDYTHTADIPIAVQIIDLINDKIENISYYILKSVNQDITINLISDTNN